MAVSRFFHSQDGGQVLRSLLPQLGHPGAALRTRHLWVLSHAGNAARLYSQFLNSYKTLALLEFCVMNKITHRI